MEASKGFLLKKIVNYSTNGFDSLGELHAQHIDDLSKIITEYAVETVLEVVRSLNEGETIDMNGHILSIKKRKK